MKGRSVLWSDRSGFTIIELIVACAIIAILGSITVAGFSVWLPSYELNRAVRDLYANMQQAKMAAIKEQRDCFIKFTPNVGYEVTGVTRTVVFSEEYGRGGVRFGGAPGATPTPPANGYEPITITFNSRGGINETAPTNGYWAYLTNEKGSAYYRVGPRSTGVIRLQKYLSSSYQG